jgi:methyl-accepting chemotaxis protein
MNYAGIMAMSWISKLNIGGRVRLAFGGLVFAVALVGGVGLYQASQMQAAAHHVGHDYLPSVSTIGRLSAEVERFRKLQAALIIASTPETKAMVAQRVSDSLEGRGHPA